MKTQPVEERAESFQQLNLDRALPSPSPLRSLLLNRRRPRAHLHALFSLAAAGTRGPPSTSSSPCSPRGRRRRHGGRRRRPRRPRLADADADASGVPRASFENRVRVDASLSLKAAFAEIAVSAYKAEVRSVDFRTKLAKKLHPDTNKGDADAERKFQEVQRAYETLKDEQKRSFYDQVVLINIKKLLQEVEQVQVDHLKVDLAILSRTSLAAATE
uniref:J domain-containing protein n=1 Tax=Ananas comosus var. bracteatus TaxID=296719 RepID=A0A6V7PBG2_ANACO|nr:unnamed protein product [Ananas comosus var. bracteatus]